MRLLTQLLLLAALIITVLTQPLPVDIDDIERRWSQGESEANENFLLKASIHATHNIRDATPAWPVRRSYLDLGGDSFAYATDERTMEMRRFKPRKRSESTASPSLVAKMKAFVQQFYRSRADSSVSGERRAVEVDEAPVLTPRRNFRHHFKA